MVVTAGLVLLTVLIGRAAFVMDDHAAVLVTMVLVDGDGSRVVTHLVHVPGGRRGRQPQSGQRESDQIAEKAERRLHQG